MTRRDEDYFLVFLGGSTWPAATTRCRWRAASAPRRSPGQRLEEFARPQLVQGALGHEGFVSPYLKSFVMARSNPLRFMKEPPELEELIKTIRGKVERFHVDKIKQEDIVASGGGVPDEE